MTCQGGSSQVANADLIFLDCETLGLDPDAPVWEFAAIRRSPEGDIRDQFFIRHDPAGWLDDFPDTFKTDYLARYDSDRAYTEAKAADVITSITQGCHIVGAVPSFDTERLGKLLQRNGYNPQPWHYHLVDVENVVVGWLHGVAARAVDEARMRGVEPDSYLVHRRLNPPWKSDDLSRAVGVDPEKFERHTAMGDVLWTVAQWDAVIGGAA